MLLAAKRRFRGTLQKLASPIMLIYLDLNVMLDILHDRDERLTQYVNSLHSRHIRFPYSPAHIEETACIWRDCEEEDKSNRLVDEQLRFISAISRNMEFLPSQTGPTRVADECPSICMKRVVDEYGVNFIVEDIEDALWEIRGKGSKNLPPDIFKSALGRDALIQKLGGRGLSIETVPRGEELLKNHNLLENTIDAMFRALAEVGFMRDPKSKLRSAIHDVSHAIYATRAHYFVSGDQRFLDRVKVVYSFLDAECEPLSKDEFLTLDL